MPETSPSRCQSPLSLPRGFPSRCHSLLIVNRPFPASRPSHFLPYIAGPSTTSTCLFVSPIYCHIRSLSLLFLRCARPSVRLSVSSTSLPLCSLSSASRCHPVFCRDLRIILILVCCLYAVLPYISHSLVAPLICCHSLVSRAAVCRDAASSSFAVCFHLISPSLDPFALLFAPIAPPLSVASICCALGRSHTCPRPRPLASALLPDGGVLFPLCALLPWRTIVKIIIDHSSRFLAPAMLFYALFFMLVALEHDGLNRASAVKSWKILQKLVKTEKAGDFSI